MSPSPTASRRTTPRTPPTPSASSPVFSPRRGHVHEKPISSAGSGGLEKFSDRDELFILSRQELELTEKHPVDVLLGKQGSISSSDGGAKEVASEEDSTRGNTAEEEAFGAPHHHGTAEEEEVLGAPHHHGTAEEQEALGAPAENNQMTADTVEDPRGTAEQEVPDAPAENSQMTANSVEDPRGTAEQEVADAPAENSQMAEESRTEAIAIESGLLSGRFFLILGFSYCIMALAGEQMVYEVLRIFNQIFLHLFTYGVDILLWTKTGIDYNCLFKLDSTKKLKYMEVFLICPICMALVVIVMFAYVILIRHGYSSMSSVKKIPGILILMFLLAVMCWRYHCLKVIRNILPFLFKVTMLHAFMADQLCSQAPMLRSLGYVVSYYLNSNEMQDYGSLANALSLTPFILRAIQCLVLSLKEWKMSHVFNFGKYFTATVEEFLKIEYEKEKSGKSFRTSIRAIATLYQLSWDIVNDWGLLQFKSKNPWLRDELILRNKNIYFLSTFLNVLLRFAWLLAMPLNQYLGPNYRVMSTVLAALEVMRRGLWNFHRLEYEHAKNASDEMDQV